MSISNTNRKAGPFTGNGTASSFPFYFKVFEAADLQVVRLDVGTNLETVLAITADYTVTLNANQDATPGGTVVLTAGALASGYLLTITSAIGNLQPTNLTNQGGFYPDVIEDALDRTTIQIQQISETLDRAITVPISSTASTQLPYPQGSELIGWNSTGDALQNVSPASLASVVAYATAYADTFTGDGTTTAWTLTANPAVLYNLDVSINGVTQVPVIDYTLSGTTFITTTAAPLNAVILVKYKEGLPNYSGDSQDVRYVPSGTGAVTTTVQSKLRETVSVFDFMTAAQIADVQAGTLALDVTAACQAALDAYETVHFPAGSYRIDTELNISSNTYIIGAGTGVTTLYQFMQSTGTYPSTGVETGTSPNASNKRQYGLIHANCSPPPYYGTPYPTTFVQNIVIRDISFNGQTEQSSVFKFNYYTHLLSLNGVKDVLIDNCEFIGYRCDGIFLGDEWFTEKYNVNVTIQNCLFDGVNFYNRNGISVIVGNGVNILNNTFRNTSQPDMPGPIDVEPNAASWYIVKNILIQGNRIESYGGGFGISVYTKSAPTMETMFGINISDNYISGNTTAAGASILVVSGESTISSSTSPMGITIKNNVVTSDQAVKKQAFLLYNIRDVLVEGNSFNGGSVAQIGFLTISNTTAYDITVKDNSFYQNGNAYGALVIGSAENLTIDGNCIQSPNYDSAPVAIEFFGSGVTTASNNVKILNNTFVKGTSQTYTVGASGHTLGTATNYYYGNRNVGGSLTNLFTYNYGRAELCYSGTFTPVLYDTGGGLTITQTSTGNYFRIGDLVNITVNVTVTAISGVASGNLYISGLPFASNSTAAASAGAVTISNVDIPAGYSYVNCTIAPSTSYINLRQQGDNVVDSGLSAAATKSNSVFRVSIMYQV